MRGVNVLIVLALAAAGCSGEGGGAKTVESATRTTETGTATTETGTATTGDGLNSGPIVVVAIAHDVGEDGVPVDPALEFAPDDEQITVVVRLGGVEPGVPLKVAWTWLDGPDGEQSLFAHEIGVGSGDAAFSHGIASSGPLAAGRYRATASLGASTVDAMFAVRPDPITLPGSVSNFAGASEPEEPAPPASGPSGAIPAPRENSTNGACQPWVEASSRLAMTGANGCGDNEFEVTARVGDNPPRGYGRWIGDFIKPVAADPCDLGGSDLEAEPISYTVTVIAGDDAGKAASGTGPPPAPDTHAPLAFLASEPTRPGGQVSEGETIVVVITADDNSSVDSIVSGIASVVLKDDTGREVDGFEFAGPEACDKSRLRRVVRLRYVVPENPPEVVKLVAIVSDYEGHEASVEATYPTVGLWTGYMDVVSGGLTAYTIGGASVRCTTGWEFKVVVFAPASGELYGYAEGLVTAPFRCDQDFAPIEWPAESVGISGTITPDAITLRFEYRSGGGGTQLLYRPPVPDIVLTRQGNLAYGDINLSLTTPVPDNSFTEDLIGRIDLGCDEC